MTFDTEIKTLLQKRYNQSRDVFTFKPPTVRKPTVVIIDVMQWVKILTEEMRIYTTQDMVDYIVKRCARFNCAHVEALIVSLDRWTPDIKKLICHGSRYKNVQVLSPADAPHLPSDATTPLSQARADISGKNWLRFAASGDNLRRELAPLLVNAFITSRHLVLLPHQAVYLNGFPVKFREMTVFQNANPESFAIPEYGAFFRQLVPVAWSVDASGDGFGDLPITPAMEASDPDIYNRVVRIFPVAGGGRQMQACPEMDNHIGEGDHALFWFDAFFPNKDQLIVINDGDALTIGCMYARERMVGTGFRNNQYLCLKYCKKKPGPHEDWGTRTTPPDYEYVDLNGLFCAMERDEELSQAGVNNHALPCFFLGILAGNDFFGDYCKGIGTTTMINVYFSMLPMWANLLQWNNSGLQPDPRAKRRVILDEQLFGQFTYQVYMAKYGAAVEKKRKRTANFVALQAHLEDSRYGPLPDAALIRRWSRQVTWVFDYMVNAGRGIDIDPYERHQSRAYYGYERDPVTGEPGFAPLGSLPRQRDVDEMYKRNFYKRTRKAARNVHSATTASAAVDAVRANIQQLF